MTFSNDRSLLFCESGSLTVTSNPAPEILLVSSAVSKSTSLITDPLDRLLKNSELVSKLRGCQNAESALAVISQSIQDEAA